MLLSQILSIKQKIPRACNWLINLPNSVHVQLKVCIPLFEILHPSTWLHNDLEQLHSNWQLFPYPGYGHMIVQLGPEKPIVQATKKI